MSYSSNSKLYDSLPKNWENCYGWYYYADLVRSYYNGATAYKAKDNRISNVKHCEKCNRQWQMRWVGLNGKRYYDYYEDLPTYKMTRKVCSKCQTKH